MPVGGRDRCQKVRLEKSYSEKRWSNQWHWLMLGAHTHRDIQYLHTHPSEAWPNIYTSYCNSKLCHSYTYTVGAQPTCDLFLPAGGDQDQDETWLTSKQTFATVATAETAKNNPKFTTKSPTDTSSREIIRFEMRSRYRTRAQDRREGASEAGVVHSGVCAGKSRTTCQAKQTNKSKVKGGEIRGESWHIHLLWLQWSEWHLIRNGMHPLSRPATHNIEGRGSPMRNSVAQCIEKRIIGDEWCQCIWARVNLDHLSCFKGPPSKNRNIKGTAFSPVPLVNICLEIWESVNLHFCQQFLLCAIRVGYSGGTYYYFTGFILFTALS